MEQIDDFHERHIRFTADMRRELEEYYVNQEKEKLRAINFGRKLLKQKPMNQEDFTNARTTA